MLLGSFILILALSASSAVAAGEAPGNPEDIPKNKVQETPETPFGITFTTRESANAFLKEHFPRDVVVVYFITLVDRGHRDYRPHMGDMEEEVLKRFRNRNVKKPGKLWMTEDRMKLATRMKEVIQHGLGDIPPDTIVKGDDLTRVLNAPWKRVEGWIALRAGNQEYPTVTWSPDFVPYEEEFQAIRDLCRFVNNCVRKAIGKDLKERPTPLIPVTAPGPHSKPGRIPKARGSSIARPDCWLGPAH
ncbi:hypothetical protein PgNI_05312 [Pyricularia grisea]|uniref:Uncharacterized protein n=1 Tax=Pyricularia grisea TaxID=148305 RepID=A0A6P8B5S5_PYRGI|nr:hypothetical protein PgNI_05312 [Pyricularia grisea]TLD10691.1 hypothetical protein PgNI_05312 [Pyricularia grisea]